MLNRQSKSERNTVVEKNYKGLFVTDLDGTLLNDDLQIGKKDLAALAQLGSQHVVTAIATGRSYFSFNKLMRQLGYLDSKTPLAIQYVIFSTGAGLMDFPGGKIRKSFSLPHEDVMRVSRYLEELGVDYMVQKPVPKTNHFIYSSHGGNNSDFQTRIDLYGDFATSLTPENLRSFGDATQILCIVPREWGFSIAEKMKEKFPYLSVIKATSPLDHKSIWIEIFSPSVSKSKAVKWLAEGLGLHRGDVCAVGNDYNDEDLLHWAGTGYVTRNSPQNLRQQFLAVGSNNNNGVCEAVLHWTREKIP